MVWKLKIIAGEWWKKDIMEVLEEFVQNGGGPQISDAFTINGQPGDLYPCSKSGQISLQFRDPIFSCLLKIVARMIIFLITFFLYYCYVINRQICLFGMH